VRLRRHPHTYFIDFNIDNEEANTARLAAAGGTDKFSAIGLQQVAPGQALF